MKTSCLLEIRVSDGALDDEVDVAFHNSAEVIPESVEALERIRTTGQEFDQKINITDGNEVTCHG